MHQVRYFLAVAKHLNFTKAAAECNVSQPSLTRAVKLLEEEFGGLLFHRERSGTRLSELGRIVEPHLEQVLAEAHVAKQRALDSLASKKVKLDLGIMCTIAPTQLIELIGGLRTRHPDIEMAIKDASADELDAMLLDGTLEVAIYCLPNHEPDERLHVMPLYREQMMIVVPPDHPLAERSEIRVVDLHGLDYVNRAKCEFDEYVAGFFDAKGVDCRTAYSSERDDWVLAMIRAGLGFGFIPQFCITDPNVVARPLVEPTFWRTVNLCTVRGRPHSPAVGALLREAMRVTWYGRTAAAVTDIIARHRTDVDQPTLK